MSTKIASGGYAPGWQTDELGEEWVESDSPPPRSAASPSVTKAPTNAASVKAKRGSLRMLGHASARGLPPSRTASVDGVRVVSGHEGRPLIPSGDFIVPRDDGLMSPPPSDVENAGPSDLAAGTFVVKDGVDDDRGKAFARAAAVGKGKDIFGKNALERMFEPPSPPNQEPPAPLGNTKRVPSVSNEPRRISHPYAPVNPSRLSKSVTPSTASTSTLPMPSGNFDESLIHEQTLPPEGEQSFVYPEEVDTIEELTRNYTLQSGEIETDLSPFTRPDYPFTFNAPRTASGGTVSGTGSGSATIRGGTVGSEFAPRWDPDEDYQEAGDYPSHSTLHLTKPRAIPALSRTALPVANKRLQLFRSTYDTYTREHLSAMADSFAVGEASDSPPRRPKDASPDSTSSHGSGSDLGEGTSRSSKRLRLSPPSPRRAPRDWGAQGRALMDKIKLVEDSTTSGSRAESSSDDRLEVEESSPSPEHHINDRTHTPPLDILFPSRLANGKPGHRSNPSTTSSGYLRAAEDLMARIKSRVVSGSASGLDNSPHDSHQDLSEVEVDDDLLREENSTLAVPVDKGKKRPGPSPRRMLRRLSTSEDIRRAADEDSSEEPSPASTSPRPSSLPTRRPTSQPSLESGAPRPPIPQDQADDLNRFVSATTIATATTATTMTTSFVKHAGPAPPARNMRMIKPDEVEAFMAERVGRMKYDKANMKWVRDRPALGTVREGGSEGSQANKTGSGKSEESVDVFAGMDSLGEERVASLPRRAPVPAVPADAILDSTDSESGGDHAVEPPAEHSHFVYDDSEDSISDADSDDLLGRIGEGTTVVSSPEILPIRPASSVPLLPAAQQISPPLRPVPHHASSAPAILTPAPSGLTKPIRSALRNPNSDTPGIKKRTGFHPELTPGLGRSQTRSVSFSDGRKSGKIRDLNAELELAATAKTGNLFADKSSGSVLPSTRTRRIHDLLEDMDDLSLEESTPSKPSRTNEPIREPATANFAEADTEIGNDTTITGLPIGSRTRNAGDATFLTECSFGVAHDRLVRLITDVQPFEPYWEDLREIDLSGKGADSVARLKEFLPKLEEINLNNNSISYLYGIPGGLRVLHATSNRLTSMSSVNHLLNLRVLDLSNNQLDSLSHLSCLKHLQDLTADNNKIRDITGIFNLEGLVNVSLRGNRISSVDLRDAKWAQLESLNLAQNCFEGVRGLEGLKRLKSLDLESNGLDRLSLHSPLITLRTLRISGNRLSSVDLAQFPKLRTLYADENSLRGVDRSDGSKSRLEALSLRNQKVKGLRLSHSEISGVKRLYVSGNHLDSSFFPASRLERLIYLEAAACQMSSWPSELDRRMPNLEVINLNYNYLESADGLRACSNLRKVMLVGNRLGGSDRDALRGLRGLHRLEEVDLRMNPLTLGFYLPLMSSPPSSAPDSQPAPAPNKTAILLGRPTYSSSNRSTTFHHPFLASHGEAGEDWAFMDREFRKKMADGWYTRRLAYRARVMEYTGARVLDGLEVSEGERRKGKELLARSR